MPVYSWSTTAANNATADSTIAWPEGMAPSAVNDSARAEMAAVAKYRDDNNGSLTTAGTSTAYTLTTASVYDTLAHLDAQSITFKVHTTSGASPTLNVDGLGAKAINGSTTVAVATGALISGNTYTATFRNSTNEFILDANLGALATLTVTGVASIAGKLSLTSTDSAALAKGTTAQRNGSPTEGDVRYNSTLHTFEFYDGSGWVSGFASASPPEGRLTLTTNTPVLTATVSGATTVYYTPYLGRWVPIYNGTNMVMTDTGGELSQTTIDTTKSPAAVGASSLYDIFVWNDSGTIRATRGPTWATGGGSATARGTGAGSTALSYIQGFWTNTNAITNGPGANKGTYVGTIASNASSTVDFIFGASASGGTASVLNVWNMYNRVTVASTVQDSTSAYAYTTASFRSADNSTAMRATYVCGQAEDAVAANYQSNSGGQTSAAVAVGVGVDSVTVNSAVNDGWTPGATNTVGLRASYSGVPGLGQHFLQALEYGQTAATFNTTTTPRNTGFAVTLRM